MNVNNTADRIRNDEKINAIRNIFDIMAKFNVTLEELNNFKEVKACGTGEYSKFRSRLKRVPVSRVRKSDTVTPKVSNVFQN